MHSGTPPGCTHLLSRVGPSLILCRSVFVSDGSASLQRELSNRKSHFTPSFQNLQQRERRVRISGSGRSTSAGRPAVAEGCTADGDDDGALFVFPCQRRLPLLLLLLLHFHRHCCCYEIRKNETRCFSNCNSNQLLSG